jgi:hypothetical protein
MAETLRLVDWRPVRKGKLLGFALVELPMGLRIHDVPVLHGKNGVWATLPTKPELDGNRRQRRDVAGEPSYARVLSWSTKRLEDAFAARVVALVQAKHPQDLA